MYSIKKANDCRGTSDGTFPKPWRFIARVRLLKRPQGGENLEGEWTDLLCTTFKQSDSFSPLSSDQLAPDFLVLLLGVTLAAGKRRAEISCAPQRSAKLPSRALWMKAGTCCPRGVAFSAVFWCVRLFFFCPFKNVS